MLFNDIHNCATSSILRRIEGAILIIDDEPDIRETLADILGVFTESPIYHAANGHEGLQVFQQAMTTIALIFLDMNMPVMNGEETYAQLQQIAPQAKVIISSSLSPTEIRLRLRKNELPAILQKPYSIDDLVETITTLFLRDDLVTLG